MTLTDVLNKTCVIGLSYFSSNGQLLKQSQLCGRVTSTDSDNGISVVLQGADATSNAAPATFILPPNLNCWFSAPPGHYRNPETGVDMENPDYLVTWDVYQTRDDSAEGEHSWWEWVPRTEPPQVGQTTH